MSGFAPQGYPELSTLCSEGWNNLTKENNI